MIFYEFELKTIPEIIFCADVTIENYSNTFHNRVNFLELSLILKGRYYRQYTDNTRDICRPKCFNCINQQSDYDTLAVDKELQRHISVGLNVEYNCVRHETEQLNDIERLKNDVIKKGTILIPDMCELEEYNENIISIFQELIWSYLSKNPKHVLYAKTHLYNLFAMLTEFVLDRIDKSSTNVSPTAIMYVENAKKYIEKHYKEKILISDIAEKIGISEGYLFVVFKKITGMTIMHYVTRHKINAFIQYVKEYNLNLCEAGVQVGIEDPAYMSRLFKKVKGISFRKYFDKIQ